MLHFLVVVFIVVHVVADTQSLLSKQGVIIPDGSLVGYTFYEGIIKYVPPTEPTLYSSLEDVDTAAIMSAGDCYAKCASCICDNPKVIPEPNPRCKVCEYCNSQYIWDCTNWVDQEILEHVIESGRYETGCWPPNNCYDHDDKYHRPESKIEINVNHGGCNCTINDIENNSLQDLCTQYANQNVNQTSDRHDSTNTSDTNQVGQNQNNSQLQQNQNGLGNLYPYSSLLTSSRNDSSFRCLVGCPLAAYYCLVFANPAECVEDPVPCLSAIVIVYETCISELDVCVRENCGGEVVASLAKRNLTTSNKERDDEADENVLEELEKMFIEEALDYYIDMIVEKHSNTNKNESAGTEHEETQKGHAWRTV